MTVYTGTTGSHEDPKTFRFMARRSTFTHRGAVFVGVPGTGGWLSAEVARQVAQELTEAADEHDAAEAAKLDPTGSIVYVVDNGGVGRVPNFFPIGTEVEVVLDGVDRASGNYRVRATDPNVLPRTQYVSPIDLDVEPPAPRMAEPQDFGHVVVDAHGTLYVRADDDSIPWHSEGPDGDWFAWDEIDTPRER